MDASVTQGGGGDTVGVIPDGVLSSAREEPHPRDLGVAGGVDGGGAARGGSSCEWLPRLHARRARRRSSRGRAFRAANQAGGCRDGALKRSCLGAAPARYERVAAALAERSGGKAMGVMRSMATTVSLPQPPPRVRRRARAAAALLLSMAWVEHFRVGQRRRPGPRSSSTTMATHCTRPRRWLPSL